MSKVPRTIPEGVAKFHRYAAPRYFLTGRGKHFTPGIVCLAVGVPPIAAGTIAASVEVVGITQEALNINQSAPTASKISLIARAAGMLALFAGVLNIAQGTAEHVMLSIKKGILFILTGLITLGIEKLVRVVQARGSAKQLAALVKTDEDMQVLREEMQKLPVNMKRKLIRQLEKRGVDL
jgi:predicted permease